MSSLSFDEDLRSIYLNPKHPASYSSLRSVYDALRKLRPGVKKADVKSWLESLDVYTLHAPVRRRFQRRKVIAPGPYYQLQADLVDLSNISRQNGGYKFLLTAIDVFSRKAFAVPLKSKREHEVKDAFSVIFNAYPVVKYLQTDLGTEFYNKTVRSYLKDKGIKLFSTSSDTKCALVERWNRTLKQRMFKYFTANDTVRYIDVLPDLLDSYNNRRHSVLGVSPNEVNEDNARIIYLRQYKKYLSRHRRVHFVYRVGDHVRISKLNHVFRKGYLPGYQKEVFTVSRRLGTVPATYKLKDLDGEELLGSFYQKELQRVTWQRL